MKRFWDKVDKSGDCWEWKGTKLPAGYGGFQFEGHKIAAHRFVLFLVGIDIPGHCVVLHSCDNPSCVNPDHLEIGSQSQNLCDALRKGRLTSVKLTESDIVEIRQRPNDRLEDIADDLGISRSQVWNVRSGKCWKHIK